jgi:hypothetical protein
MPISIEEAINCLKEAGLEAKYIGAKYPIDYTDRTIIFSGGSKIIVEEINGYTYTDTESPAFDIWVEGKLWIVRIEDMGTPGDSWIYRHFSTLEDSIQFICELQRRWNT